MRSANTVGTGSVLSGNFAFFEVTASSKRFVSWPLALLAFRRFEASEAPILSFRFRPAISQRPNIGIRNRISAPAFFFGIRWNLNAGTDERPAHHSGGLLVKQ